MMALWDKERALSEGCSGDKSCTGDYSLQETGLVQGAQGFFSRAIDFISRLGRFQAASSENLFSKFQPALFEYLECSEPCARN